GTSHLLLSPKPPPSPLSSFLPPPPANLFDQTQQSRSCIKTTFSRSSPRSSSTSSSILNSFLHWIVFFGIVNASFTLKSLALKNFSRTTRKRKQQLPQALPLLEFLSFRSSGGGSVVAAEEEVRISSFGGGGGEGEVKERESRASWTSCLNSSRAFFSESDRSETRLLSSLNEIRDSGTFNFSFFSASPVNSSLITTDFATTSAFTGAASTSALFSSSGGGAADESSAEIAAAGACSGGGGGATGSSSTAD
ncbi:unnamed protein product, partial [Linum tenue]